MSPSATPSLPLLLSELAWSSWETIAYRCLLMARGDCSASGYSAMLTEKLGALHSSTLSMLTGGGLSAVIAPWHSGATANARRLRGGSLIN